MQKESNLKALNQVFDPNSHSKAKRGGTPTLPAEEEGWKPAGNGKGGKGKDGKGGKG